MKGLAVILCLLALAGCTLPPNYEDARLSLFTQANHDAVDSLTAATTVPIKKDLPLLVATLVNIDSLNESSRFGRLISEQISARLTQRGFHVVEMKLRNDVYVREGTGELLLSRDVRELSRSYKSQAVVVGSYAVASGYVYLTLKLVTVADNRIVSAVNYTLPLTENTLALLPPVKSKVN